MPGGLSIGTTEEKEICMLLVLLTTLPPSFYLPASLASQEVNSGLVDDGGTQDVDSDPTRGSDLVPVIPPGGGGAPLSTSSGQRARPTPGPQGAYNLRREPNTAKITMNAPEGEGIREALMKFLSWPLAFLG